MARDLDRMLESLRAYLGCGTALTDIVPLSTGHSNETYRLDGIDRILRLPPSEEGLLPPYDMAAQHAVLAAVGACADGPPVPAVHELCTDAGVIGDPFFLMSRIDGEAFEYTTPAWLAASPAATRDRMCAQWIGAVAALHRLPPAVFPARPRTAVEEASHWLGVARASQAEAALIEVLEDLARRPPRPSGPPTPIHGDPKHGNCLWSREGELRALVDWEMAGIGDPLLDLAYIMQFYDMRDLASAGFELPGWWSRDRTIDEWQRATGRSAVNLARYEALEVAKVGAILALGVALHKSGRASDARFGTWAAVLPAYTALAVRCAAG